MNYISSSSGHRLIDHASTRVSTGSTYQLSASLGSTSIVTDATGTLTSQQRYLPFGAERTDVTSPSAAGTDYGYTGQRELDPSTGGLMDYKARFYSVYLNRFVQPDTIVPNMFYSQSLNRYAYVNNSPMVYVDPSGNLSCKHANAAEGDCTDVQPSPQLLVFKSDDGESFTSEEMEVLKSGAQDVATAFAGMMNAECRRMILTGEGCSGLVTPQEAFYQVFGGSITVRRKDDSESCDCWAMHQGMIDGHYEIWVYSTTSAQDIIAHPNLIVHEIGHAFYWAAGGYIEGSSVGGRNGFYGPYYQWQFGHDSPKDLGTEIFADMFLGWTYGKWEQGILPSGLSINGQYKSDYMAKYMPLMVNNAIGR